MTGLWLKLAILGLVSATHVKRGGLSNPTVKNASLIAVVTDTNLDRDSGGSTMWGSKILWTYRDTSTRINETQIVNFFTNSASYSDINPDGTIPLSPVPPIQREGSSLKYPAAYILYGNNSGEPFFPYSPDECPGPAGACSDGSREVHWPSTPPLVTSPSGTLTAYSFIKSFDISGLSPIIPDPSTTLYKMTGTDDQTELPTVSIVDEYFFAQGVWAYGEYGNVIVGDTAYLYGNSNANHIGLARVKLCDVEDISQYEYYVGGQWTSSQPNINTTSAYVDVGGNGGGQGTFYYSQPWDQFVWIGQPGGCACTNFLVSVSPSPEGPWTNVTTILDVVPGNYTGIGAYTMQAHPEFVPGPEQNSIHLTYTQQYTDHYETPMYLIEWD